MQPTLLIIYPIILPLWTFPDRSVVLSSSAGEISNMVASEIPRASYGCSVCFVADLFSTALESTMFTVEKRSVSHCDVEFPLVLSTLIMQGCNMLTVEILLVSHYCSLFLIVISSSMISNFATSAPEKHSSLLMMLSCLCGDISTPDLMYCTRLPRRDHGWMMEMLVSWW